MAVARFDVNGVLRQHSPIEAQLQDTLNLLPAYAWYALPNGALTFANERSAEYLGLPKDHPIRFGKVTGAEWDSHILLCIRTIAKRRFIREAIVSGELKGGTDTKLLIDALNGPAFFRWLQGHTPLGNSFAERIFDKVILGFHQ